MSERLPNDQLSDQFCKNLMQRFSHLETCDIFCRISENFTDHHGITELVWTFWKGWTLSGIWLHAVPLTEVKLCLFDRLLSVVKIVQCPPKKLKQLCVFAQEGEQKLQKKVAEVIHPSFIPFCPIWHAK